MSDDRFAGCILGGAIGDAWGSCFENKIQQDDSKTYYWGGKPIEKSTWSVTDDTQLTLATCDTMGNDAFDAGLLAGKFLEYYRLGKLSGLGASTLKAITELGAGQHWSQCGRKGEYAAGNGAAMRIAPLAFLPHISRQDIYNACIITHKNDEAYTAALAVFLSVKAILQQEWTGDNNLFDLLIPQLPDTRLRDRLIEINNYPDGTTIAEIARLGNNGYAVNSVPLAIFAAANSFKTGIELMFEQLIAAGGDTDTNCSIAGQIAGTLTGKSNIPKGLLAQLQLLKEYSWIENVIEKTISKCNRSLL